MTPLAVDQAVALYVAARHRRQRIAVLPADCRPASLDEAYDVQAALNERLCATHGAVCGRKIGCTTPVMQRYLEIAHPCAGALYEQRTLSAPATVTYADHWRPGVECEIAVRLGSPLPTADAPFDRAAVADAVEACMAAIEIVDDRYEDFRALDTPTLIADDFFSAGAVLGPAVAEWRGVDLAAAGGVMTINGAHVGAGTGADVMGHPFEALTWLANHAAASARPLQSGDVVLTGSVVETKWVEPGDTVRAAIEGLGEASVTFAR
ncbi:MAG: fumarylacetoacetate hydrolase family protein [Rhodospirillales bacterium]|nr:fumarylacetoacetate hydrolase family protein [Rhodospirillales bacterium]